MKNIFHIFLCLEHLKNLVNKNLESDHRRTFYIWGKIKPYKIMLTQILSDLNQANQSHCVSNCEVDRTGYANGSVQKKSLVL